MIFRQKIEKSTKSLTSIPFGGPIGTVFYGGTYRNQPFCCRVASIQEVRATLSDFQRRFAQRLGGSILDGRDIGTAICPDADLKLFITAAPEVRAERRLEELREKGVTIDYETVLADVRARDAKDMSRKDAPLIAAQDAKVIDTSDLTIGQSTERAVTLIQAALNDIDQ